MYVFVSQFFDFGFIESSKKQNDTTTNKPTQIICMEKCTNNIFYLND